LVFSDVYFEPIPLAEVLALCVEPIPLAEVLALCVEPIPLADVLVWRDDSIKGREIT
jgi:hypothetical protein